ncbi:PucR family transcriptional regulator [Nonomuraea lactucae]|uniref:PucR family transcriptional regulator n=1 Tax=Nonomuraea lactucae TaxID=2249762 RepID=UPI000DE2E87E|nr:PucR family transcriptional regulator [Nonomuraea lactucae]
MEDLAEELGRGIIVLDANRKVLAFQLYGDDAISFAKETVLRRRLSGDAIFTETAVLESKKSTRPAGLRIPLVHQGEHVGDLWILEGAEPSEEVLQRAKGESDEIAKHLFRQHVVRGFREAFRNELAGDLLSGSERVRERALNDLVSNDIASPETAVRVVTLAYLADDQVGARQELDEIVGRIRRSALPAAPLVVQRADHTAFLVLAASTDWAVKESDRVAKHLANLIENTGPDQRDRLHLSAGSPRGSLLEAYVSYEESLLARGVRPAGEPVASWPALGAFQTLLLIPRRQRSKPDICRRLANVAGDLDHLLITLETFLDNAGNVQKTAQDLFVHRTTLYHRLRRIEVLLDVDLDDGQDRLEAHLGIKLLSLL